MLGWRIESKDTKHYSNEDASANEVDALVLATNGTGRKTVYINSSIRLPLLIWSN